MKISTQISPSIAASPPPLPEMPDLPQSVFMRITTPIRPELLPDLKAGQTVPGQESVGVRSVEDKQHKRCQAWFKRLFDDISDSTSYLKTAKNKLRILKDKMDSGRYNPALDFEYRKTLNNYRTLSSRMVDKINDFLDKCGGKMGAGQKAFLRSAAQTYADLNTPKFEAEPFAVMEHAGALAKAGADALGTLAVAGGAVLVAVLSKLSEALMERA